MDKYSYYFEEMDGDDSIGHAIIITDGAKTIAKLDFADFGQLSCSDCGSDLRKTVEILAMRMVNGLNFVNTEE